MKFDTKIYYQIIDDKTKDFDKVPIKKVDILEGINTYDDFDCLRSSFQNRKKIFIRPKRKLRLIYFQMEAYKHYNINDRYFLNGYQSSTDSFEFPYKTKLKDSKNIGKKFLEQDLDKLGETDFYTYQKNVLHGFDIAYINGINELFIGSLDYKHAYLIIEFYKKKDRLVLNSDVFNQICEPDEDFMIIDIIITNSIVDGILEYRSYFEPKTSNKLFSFGTKNNYFGDINEGIIKDLIDDSEIKGLLTQFDLFLIDEGYQCAIGDWMDIDKEKFPSGFKEIVDKIHSKRMKAGIWLCPFVCEKESRLYKEHYDWLKKDEDGNLYSCGKAWSGVYALDLDNQEVLDYIRKCLEYFIDLGFDYFKLDYLFASNKGTYFGKSRCSKAYEMYSFLREILKGKLILGCNAPLLNGAGLFDYMRVAPDITLTYDDGWFMKNAHRERASTKVNIQNTIYRSFIDHYLFLNDGDAFVLREDGNKLTPEQKETLIIVNALFSSTLQTSDSINKYSEKSRQILDRALYIFYNARNTWYTKLDENQIKLTYEIKGMQYNYIYDIKKGTITFIKV